MTGPSLATQKSLFARSSNICAFPKCPVKMVDGNTVIGEICHIKGNKPDAPRYDPNQTPEERHGYDNLLLLCGTHHTVIDADVNTYTVGQLTRMKDDHECGAVPMSDDLATRAAMLLADQSVQSVNQSGGMTAQTIHIHNYAQQPASGGTNPRTGGEHGTIYFVPDAENAGWAENDGRCDIHAVGAFTYDGQQTLNILDVFVKETPSKHKWSGKAHVGNTFVTLTNRLALEPRTLTVLSLYLACEPIKRDRGLRQRFHLVFRDNYKRDHEIDPVDFAWIGPPVSAAPTVPSSTMWQSLSGRFKAIDAKPIQVWADWIYTIETKQYQWHMEPGAAAPVAVRMCMELCKEGGKMLLAEPEFCRKFPEITALINHGDRWLVAVDKVAEMGKLRRNTNGMAGDVVTHSEGGEIRDVPGASQVLCQMAVNGFSE